MDNTIEKTVAAEHAEDSSSDDAVAIHTDVFDISPEALGINLHENPYYYRDPKFIGVVVAMALGYWSTIVGWSLPANSLLLIDKDIGPSKNITWVALSNTLGLSVSFLLVGRLSDIFGRRWFFIIGNCLALIGAIIGAVAPSINDLIAGNLFNGLAGAVQISFAIAIAELVPNKHRPLWVGGLLFAGGPLIGFGPIIAQVFGYDTAKSWRWNYYTAIIVAAITIILLVICYHPPNFHMLHKRRTRWEQFKRQDFIGMCLYIAGLVLLLMGVSWGGGSYPWKSAHVIATIVVGVLTLVAFGVYDHFFKGDKLMPMYLFVTPGYLAMVLTAMVASSVYYGMSILWPQEVAYLFGGSAVRQGFLDCVLGIGTVVGQGIGGIMVHYIKQTRYILIASTVTLTAFAAAMVSVGVGESAKGVGLLFVTSFAFGVIETASLSLAPLSCPPEDLGLALGTLGSIRSAGGSIGAAIYATILTNKLASITPEKVSAAALAAGLPQSSLASLLASQSNTTAVVGITPRITAAVALATAQAAAKSFQYVWYAVIAFGCLSIAASMLTSRSYDKYLTDDVARRLQGTHAHHAHHAHDEEKTVDM